MVAVVSILEIIYQTVTFKMAKMLVLFLFFIITNWVKRSNICSLALCQKKIQDAISSLSEWVMKVNEILWMKRQQMASLHYVCLV